MILPRKGGLINPYDRSENPTDNEEIKDDIKTIPGRYTILFLELIGGMPCTWKRPHTPSLHPTKSTLLAAILLYLVFLYSGYAYYDDIVGQLRQRKSVQAKIMAMEITLISLSQVITLCVWSDIPRSSRGIKLWIKLAISYRQITGRRLTARCQRVERIRIFLIVFMTCVAYGMAKATLPIELSYVWAPAIVHNNSVLCSVCYLWKGNFSSLEILARDINRNIKEELRNNSLTHQKLRQYRKIWLQMRDLSDSWSTSNSPVIIGILNVSFIIIFTYNSILLYVDGNVPLGVVHNLFSTLFIFLLFGMARTSHCAIQEIKRFYSEIVAVESLERLPNGVISLYLLEKSRTIVPSFGGYVLVNKTLVPSIISAIATHIVMMAQFFPHRKNENL